ncbi:MAG: hypothetical protein QXV60_03555 [Nitrososphaerota archaeon]
MIFYKRFLVREVKDNVEAYWDDQARCYYIKRKDGIFRWKEGSGSNENWKITEPVRLDKFCKLPIELAGELMEYDENVLDRSIYVVDRGCYKVLRPSGEGVETVLKFQTKTDILYSQYGRVVDNIIMHYLHQEPSYVIGVIADGVYWAVEVIEKVVLEAKKLDLIPFLGKLFKIHESIGFINGLNFNEVRNGKVSLKWFYFQFCHNPKIQEQILLGCSYSFYNAQRIAELVGKVEKINLDIRPIIFSANKISIRLEVLDSARFPLYYSIPDNKLYISRAERFKNIRNKLKELWWQYPLNYMLDEEGLKMWASIIDKAKVRE